MMLIQFLSLGLRLLFLGVFFSGCSSNLELSVGALTSLSLSQFGGISGTVITKRAPTGMAYSSVIIDLGSGFQASNICSSATIFGLAGTASCVSTSSSQLLNVLQSLASTAAREPQTTQLYQIEETSTYQGVSLPSSGSYQYRDVPSSSRDDEGVSGNVLGVVRVGFVVCGSAASMVGTAYSPNLVSDRIQHCALLNGTSAKWNGTVSGNSGQAIWLLVTNLGGGSEVWQDQRTGLLWSSLVATAATWCQASGNAEGGQVACASNTTSACSEVLGFTSAVAGENWSQKTYANAKGNMGAKSFPAVAWRLPSTYDYMRADLDGILFVMPDMGQAKLIAGASEVQEWASTLTSTARAQPYTFFNITGKITTGPSTSGTTRVRCVGR